MTETTAVLINLENCWRPLSQNNGTFSDFENMIKSLLEKTILSNDKQVVFFFALTREPEFLPHVYEWLLIPLKRLLESIGINQLNFITWSASTDWLDLHIKYKGNIENISYKNITVCTPVQYYMLWDHYRVRTSNQLTNKVPNQTADTCLLLTGKALSFHRMGLIDKFYKRGLMGRLQWSLFINDYVREHGREFVPGYTDEEYYKFLEDCERYPDGAITHGSEAGEKGPHTGYPYDVKLFENTSLSIISETKCERQYDSVVLTEKTWKTISNNHPFIMVHVPGALKKLKELGFRTFEEYMLIKDYDSIVDTDARLNSVVDNMEYFLDNYAVNAENIVRDIQHNYSRYQEYCAEEFGKINARIAKHGVSAEDFLFKFRTPDSDL